MIKEIAKLNYEAQLKRGQIDETSTPMSFISRIAEENNELFGYFVKHQAIDPSELADVTLVCFSMAQHFNIDLVEEMRKKAEYNMIRED